MALASNGDLLVSDGTGGGIYLKRAGRNELHRVDGGDFISPQTPAYSRDRNVVFVPDYVRGIGVLDLATKRVRWIPMQNSYPLEGIDGMYFHHGELIAVQNGTSPVRVMTFRFDAGFTHVLSQTAIQNATPRIDPNRGVLVGNDFYYIANAGWDSIDDAGGLKPGARRTPARIMRFRLPS